MPHRGALAFRKRAERERQPGALQLGCLRVDKQRLAEAGDLVAGPAPPVPRRSWATRRTAVSRKGRSASAGPSPRRSTPRSLAKVSESTSSASAKSGATCLARIRAAVM